MGLFVYDGAENRLSARLRALIEEFGVENITLVLPSSWRKLNQSVGRLKCSYSAVSSIQLLVSYEGSHLCYLEPLRSADLGVVDAQ